MIRKGRERDAVLEGRRILVVEDDVRNVYRADAISWSRAARRRDRPERPARRSSALEKSTVRRPDDRPGADGRDDAR